MARAKEEWTDQAIPKRCWLGISGLLSGGHASGHFRWASVHRTVFERVSLWDNYFMED